MENKQLLSCIETLKENTDRASKTLSNASTLKVLIAMTRLKQKGNESYLKAYEAWLDEKLNKEEILIDNSLEVQ